MADFPTLSRTPRVIPFKRTVVTDPTVRSPFDSGHMQTRSRYTRVPKQWSVFYDALPVADKVTLATFESDTAYFGAVTFNWVNPEDSVAYNVRFDAPIVYRPWQDTNYLYWTAEFTVTEE